MSAAPDTKVLTRRQRLPEPFDLVATVAPLRNGPDDPTTRVVGGEVWRALRTADGPATLHLRCHAGDLLASAVGPGAEAALEAAPGLAGLYDRPELLVIHHRSLAEARRRRPGLRLTAGTAVFDALVGAVLAQKVVGLDARRAYRDLARRLGEPAPGGSGLLLPPDAERIGTTPSWVFHACNVEWRRASTLIAAARRSQRLNSLATAPADVARAALCSLPGVGPWTAAVVTSVSHGDPDAVPVGDFHIPNAVAFALAGEARGDDERMLQLLEPYAGQRGRVIRLLMSGGHGAPRFGPRLSRQDIRGR